jgi:large subunit ribosomal protein L32
MAVQQNKVSKQRYRRRKAANRYRGMQAGICSHCGATVVPHRLCKACGHYKGRQIISVTVG